MYIELKVFFFSITKDDFGGPVIIPGTSADGAVEYIQVGIISNACKPLFRNTVNEHTKVSTFIQWIVRKKKKYGADGNFSKRIKI